MYWSSSDHCLSTHIGGLPGCQYLLPRIRNVQVGRWQRDQLLLRSNSSSKVCSARYVTWCTRHFYTCATWPVQCAECWRICSGLWFFFKMKHHVGGSSFPDTLLLCSNLSSRHRSWTTQVVTNMAAVMLVESSQAQNAARSYLLYS